MKKRKNKSPVAFVTGAGRRLGRRISIDLARNGFDIVIHHNKSAAGARESLRMIEGMGRKGVLVSGNIAHKRDVLKMVRDARKAYGRIDLLVNSAAVFTEGTILDTSESAFDTTIDINLKGMFLCSQAVAPIMMKQKRGCIINIASLGGLQPWTKHLPYSVSKAGVIMLTRIMAKSLAPYITVNAIAPGTILMKGEEDPEINHIPVKGIPLKRYGRAGDITSLVVYLAMKATYITGQIIPVDGGRTLNF